MFRFRVLVLVFAVMLLGVQFGYAQTPEPIPLRVEAAVTGQLTSASPTVLYSFQVLESTRMGFVFDAQGDMNVTLVVFDQDQTTVLGGATGTNNNGVIVTFPSTGQYYVALSAEGGTSANYRLMIDADPPVPINTFIVQSYAVSGTSNLCAEVTPAAYLSATEDLGVCFVVGLIDSSVELTAQWWSPSGQIVVEESTTLTTDENFVPLLTGIVNSGTPFEGTWWQVHFLLNGELAHIQWVWVQE
ncbi:MAG: hypothetical protein KJ064_16000 [Anaerolineae bacterium]|nr:hypothetical protein [Anaerolineae bacterium]